jgi:hypothetical protein
MQCLCEVGPVLGCQQGGAQELGVDGGRVIEEQKERERFWQVALGFPSSLDAKCIGQTEKSF